MQQVHVGPSQVLSINRHTAQIGTHTHTLLRKNFAFSVISVTYNSNEKVPPIRELRNATKHRSPKLWAASEVLNYNLSLFHLCRTIISEYNYLNMSATGSMDPTMVARRRDQLYGPARANALFCPKGIANSRSHQDDCQGRNEVDLPDPQQHHKGNF